MCVNMFASSSRGNEETEKHFDEQTRAKKNKINYKLQLFKKRQISMHGSGVVDGFKGPQPRLTVLKCH